MKIPRFKGERWSKASRDAEKAESAAAKVELKAMRDEVENLKKGPAPGGVLQTAGTGHGGK